LVSIKSTFYAASAVGRHTPQSGVWPDWGILRAFPKPESFAALSIQSVSSTNCLWTKEKVQNTVNFMEESAPHPAVGQHY
jgi:hypothetical protein